MAPYPILLCFVMLMCILRLKNKFAASLSIILALALFSGLRYFVGFDFSSYMDQLTQISNGVDVRFEPVYYWMVHLANYFNLTIQSVFLALAFITVIGFERFIDEWSESYAFSIFLFISISVFYLNSLNVMRQFASVAFFAYSLKFINEKKLLKYILTIGVACLFHKSAIFLFPLYFVLGRNYKTLHLFICGIFAFQFLWVLQFIISKTKYYIYLNDDQTLKFMNYHLLLAYLFVVLLVACAAHVSKIKSKNYHIFINMCHISIFLIVCSLVSSLPSLIFVRFNLYFIISLLILIPAIVSNVENVYIRFILMAFIVFISLCYFYYELAYVGKQPHHIVPYNYNITLVK